MQQRKRSRRSILFFFAQLLNINRLTHISPTTPTWYVSIDLLIFNFPQLSGSINCITLYCTDHLNETLIYFSVKPPDFSYLTLWFASNIRYTLNWLCCCQMIDVIVGQHSSDSTAQAHVWELIDQHIKVVFFSACLQ